MPSPPKVYILVPIFKRIEYLQQLLNQIDAQDWPNIELVLIDHSPQKCVHSQIPTAVTCLRGTPDMWWSGAMNVGISYVLDKENNHSDSFVVFMNDDVEFDANLISGLVKSSQANSAGIGPLTLDSNRNNKKIIDANNFLSFFKAKHISPYGGKSKTLLTENLLKTDILKGRGVIYPMQTIRKVGLTNERLHYRADPEYAYRAKKSGLPLYIDTSLEVRTCIGPQKTFNKIESIKDMKTFLFSPKSPLNIKAASIYFYSCTNPFVASWCITIYAIRWGSICTLKLLLKRN